MDNLCEGRGKACLYTKNEIYNFEQDSSYANKFDDNSDYKYTNYDDKSFINETVLINKVDVEDSLKNICTYNEVEASGLNKNMSERVIDENNSSLKDNYKINNLEGKYSDKSWGITLILCILFGFIGIHRFYVGKAGTAIIMLLTLGGFGIWVLVDLIRIIINNFSDEEGKLIKRARLFS